MHPYFLNKTPCFNLLDLLTSDLRHIAGDTYKVFFEKVLTFMLRSYFGLKVDKISENPVFSRLLNFCPIITQSSTRRTMPVAFISFLSLLWVSMGIVCRKGRIMYHIQPQNWRKRCVSLSQTGRVGCGRMNAII